VASELGVGEVRVGDWRRSRAEIGNWRREKYLNPCRPRVSV